MVDIQLVRANPHYVLEKSKQKGVDINIEQLLQLDKDRLMVLQEVETLRKNRNDNADKLKGGGKPDQSVIDEGKQIKVELAKREEILTQLDNDWVALLKTIPNMPTDDTPVGQSEDDNVVVETWGEKPTFDFEPRSHWEIAQSKGWIDKERAAKVAGSRFAYIKGELVHLQFAIVQYVMNRLSDESWLKALIEEENLHVSSKPFVPIIPPMMIKTDVFDAMGRLEPKDQRYKVGESEDDLWLNGSAEHTIGSMYYKETLNEEDVPVRYIGYATSFRREAGTYGKDMEGILRLHQFDKLEMETFTSPAEGYSEHLLLVAVQKKFMKELGLHFQVMLKCTADIGDPNARGVDINTWMPGQKAYRETHSADYMSDYQARRLGTKIKNRDGRVELAHTNDATALVLSRIPAVIIEQFQTAEGDVNVPSVLHEFMRGRTQL